MDAEAEHHFVSRGGLKLAAALDRFDLDVRGWVCVDLGCNVGGFTDCLLQRGAAHVYAVDTGYGALAWKLRQDERVSVMERTNAMHVEPSLEPGQGVDLAVIDLGWTRQAHAIAAAIRWRPRWIVSLIKPHYEQDAPPAGRPRGGKGRRGILDEAEAERVARRVVDELEATEGLHVHDWMPSPIRGGKGKGRVGNVEYLVALQTP